MERKTISPWDFAAKGFSFWDRDWLLLSAGDFAKKKFNCMTVSWGFLGVMWARPMAIVVVRPQRHTRQFMDQHDSFTLCAFPMSIERTSTSSAAHRAGKWTRSTPRA